MHCSSKPYYSDPSAREAQSLLLAAYALSEAGRLDEADGYMAEAAALLKDAPYDKKARCKVLGAASYYPSGVIRVAHPEFQASFDVPSDPYEINEEADAEAVLAARRKSMRDDIMRSAKDVCIGWPASVQLSSALSGTKPRAAGRTLAKALGAIRSAADAACGCGWSDDASRIFRQAMEKCGLLPWGELGSRDARDDTERQARQKRVEADEGQASEYGGWILWFPEDVLDDMAARLMSLERTDHRSVWDIMKPALPLRRAAYFPGSEYCKLNSDVWNIGLSAVSTALENLSAPCELASSYVQEYAAQAAEGSVRTALNAKAMFDAARIFRAAADRDPDTEKTFLAMGLIPKGTVPEPGGIDWFAGIASASIGGQRMDVSAGWLKGENATPERQAEFTRAVTGNIRSGVAAWFRTEKAEEIFMPSDGAYRNCPVQATQPPED